MRDYSKLNIYVVKTDCIFDDRENKGNFIERPDENKVKDME